MQRISRPLKLLAVMSAFCLASCVKETEPTPEPVPSPSGLKYEVVAGSTMLVGLINGQGSGANFSNPSGLVLDNSGNILIADTRHNAIRKMTPSFLVSSVAGSGSGQQGNADGQVTQARFWSPYFLATDAAGTIYVADGMGNYIRKISGTQVSTVTERTTSTPRYLHSILSLPSGHVIRGMGFDKVKNRIVITVDGSRVWGVNPTTGQTTVIAGTAASGYKDGDALSSQFSELSAITVDGFGNIFVADNYRKTGSNAFNSRIRKISSAGMVTTLANFEASQSQTIYALAMDKDGESLVAFIEKLNIASGNVVSNAAFYRLVKVSGTGNVSEILEAADPYNATTADKFVFGRADGMVIDATGNIFITNGVIGRISGR